LFFFVKNSLVEKHVGVHCCDATASSFVAKVRGEIFAHFCAAAVKHQNGKDALDFAHRLSRLFQPTLN
jgi:hypothetical protein